MFKSFARNTAWMVGGQIVRMLISFVIGILTARYLGPSNYGIINYANSYTTFFAAIIGLGLNGVIIYELKFNTGGSPECIDANCGSVVPADDIDALESEIVRVCTQQPYSSEACLKRAQKFDMNERFEEYVKLYEDMR